MFPVLQTQIPSTLIMLVLAGLVFYFLLIRPARKQMALQKERQQEVQNGSQPGARVMLASGLFGTVRHVGERQIILELAPGTEVTVVKESISKIITAEDEDFEFVDESGAHEDGDDQFSDDQNQLDDQDSLDDQDQPDELRSDSSAISVDQIEVDRFEVDKAGTSPSDSGQPGARS